MSLLNLKAGGKSILDCCQNSHRKLRCSSMIHLPSNDSEFTGTHNVGYPHETVCAKSSHLSRHGCSMCRTCVMLMNRTASKAGLSALQLVSENPRCNGLAFATGETRWTKSHLMHYHVNRKIHQICAYAKSRANVLFFLWQFFWLCCALVTWTAKTYGVMHLVLYVMILVICHTTVELLMFAVDVDLIVGPLTIGKKMFRHDRQRQEKSTTWTAVDKQTKYI